MINSMTRIIEGIKTRKKRSASRAQSYDAGWKKFESMLAEAQKKWKSKKSSAQLLRDERDR